MILSFLSSLSFGCGTTRNRNELRSVLVQCLINTELFNALCRPYLYETQLVRMVCNSLCICFCFTYHFVCVIVVLVVTMCVVETMFWIIHTWKHMIYVCYDQYIFSAQQVWSSWFLFCPVNHSKRGNFFRITNDFPINEIFCIKRMFSFNFYWFESLRLNFLFQNICLFFWKSLGFDIVDNDVESSRTFFLYVVALLRRLSLWSLFRCDFYKRWADSDKYSSSKNFNAK